MSQNKKLYYFGFIITTFLISISVFHTNFSSDKNIMTVTFLDVGQGDAILIDTPNGKKVLIDTGPSDVAVKKLSNHLGHFEKFFELLIITHADLDHVGGTPIFLDRYQVKNLGYNFKFEDTAITRKISEMLTHKETRLSKLQSGDRIFLDEKNNIYLDVLWPPENFSSKDRNDLSIVVVLTFNQIDFLLTGDASLKIEKEIIKISSEKIDVEVLKLGHHGSKTSTDLNFLKITSPDYVVVSAGKDNKFGHPHPEVLEKIKIYFEGKTIYEFQDKIKQTLEGPVVFKTDGRNLWVD